MSILITRPKVQNLLLADFLSQQGLASILFPVIAVAKPAHPLVSITSAPINIFTSPTTVRALFEQLPDFQADNVLAIGAGTAQCLVEFGLGDCIVPEYENSEGMLTLDVLQDVQGQLINIFAGEAGNPQLADGLRARCASVEMIYTHQRILPEYMSVPWQVGDVEVSVCTSSQSLVNFHTLIEQLSLAGLLGKPLIVIKEAMVKQARHLGFKSAIIIAKGASNAAILAALQQR
jgi:uroporphyrinogen-III synthase